MKTSTVFLIALLIISGCKKDNNPVAPTTPGNSGGTIQIGNTVVLVDQPIGSGGGTIKINKPGDPLDGLELTLSPGSFQTAKTFKISYAPITGHQLGQYFNPVSPLINISYEGGYSAIPMKMKIPINLAAGKFAMGFLYDKSTGQVEGLPVEDTGSNFITISTSHFTSNTPLGKTGSIYYENPQTDIVISAIDETVLSKQNIIDSGFNPGTDDWEFVNYGSYIAPQGQCAGQAITEMWYYQTKKKNGSPSLFHNYDKYSDASKPNVLWQDNPLGYRFASTIQEDANWDAYIPNLNYQWGNGDFTWKTFALSMLVTGQPQFILVRQSAAPNDGHALVVYKIDYPGGKLYLADPNFPGNRDPQTGNQSVRVINFNNHSFTPYHSSLNAASPGIDFDQIGFAGKSAYIDWSQVDKRWTEFQNGTIGNDRFPSYTLYVNNTTGDKLTDGYVSNSEDIDIVCKSVDCEQYLSNTDRLQVIYVYDQNGNQLAKAGQDNKGVASIKLKPGQNKLGFYICGAKNGKSENYVDFKWINISYLKMTIDPNPLNAEVNQEYTFTANILGTPPQSGKYVWDFGDGSAEVTQININTVKHTFSQEGTYNVTVKLYDNTNGNYITIASSTVYILSSFVKDVISSYQVYISFRGNFTTDNPTITTITDDRYINGSYRNYTQNILWTGNTFTLSYNYMVPYYDPYFPHADDSLIVTGSVNGSITSDGKTISTISASEKITHTKTEEYTDSKITANNVPYFGSGMVDLTDNYYQYGSYGINLGNYISSISISEKLWDINNYETLNTVSVSYDSNSVLWIDFIKKQ